MTTYALQQTRDRAKKQSLAAQVSKSRMVTIALSDRLLSGRHLWGSYSFTQQAISEWDRQLALVRRGDQAKEDCFVAVLVTKPALRQVGKGLLRSRECFANHALTLNQGDDSDDASTDEVIRKAPCSGFSAQLSSRDADLSPPDSLPSLQLVVAVVAVAVPQQCSNRPSA